jgi:cell division protein FtsB
MLEFRQRRKVRRIIYSPITIVVLFVVVVVLAKATWNVYTKEAESRTYLDTAQAQLDNISASKSALTAEVTSLQTPEGVEENIHNQFLVVKPGEQVAVIVDGNNGDNSVESSTTSPAGSAGSNVTSSVTPGVTSSQSFWERLADFFKL